MGQNTPFKSSHLKLEIWETGVLLLSTFSWALALFCLWNVYTKEVSQGVYGDACTCILKKIFFNYCIFFLYHHLLPFSPLSWKMLQQVPTSTWSARAWKQSSHGKYTGSPPSEWPGHQSLHRHRHWDHQGALFSKGKQCWHLSLFLYSQLRWNAGTWGLGKIPCVVCLKAFSSRILLPVCRVTPFLPPFSMHTPCGQRAK